MKDIEEVIDVITSGRVFMEREKPSTSDGIVSVYSGIIAIDRDTLPKDNGKISINLGKRDLQDIVHYESDQVHELAEISLRAMDRKQQG